jgi:hypothetical protein
MNYITGEVEIPYNSTVAESTRAADFLPWR